MDCWSRCSCHETSATAPQRAGSIAGVPAALYERFARLDHSNMVSMTNWLAASVLLTLPGLLPYIG